jgi:hypothetical protein
MRQTSPTHVPPPPPAPQQHALHHAKCLTALVTASTPMPTRHTGALSRQRADSAPATTVGVLEPDTCSSTSISISIGGQDHGIGGQASHAEASADTTQCTGVAEASAPTVTCHRLHSSLRHRAHACRVYSAHMHQKDDICYKVVFVLHTSMQHMAAVHIASPGLTVQRLCTCVPCGHIADLHILSTPYTQLDICVPAAPTSLWLTPPPSPPFKCTMG